MASMSRFRLFFGGQIRKLLHHLLLVADVAEEQIQGLDPIKSSPLSSFEHM
jgi:hypothetical protein